jgi:hypothetical protein
MMKVDILTVNIKKIPERTRGSVLAFEGMLEYAINTLKLDLYRSTVIELGSWTGLSAVVLSNYFNHVTCVDGWAPSSSDIDISHLYEMKDVEDIFDERTIFIPNLQKIKGLTQDILPNFPDKSFDFCYIDAGHDYDSALHDIEECERICRSEYLFGHDYCDKFPGVKIAVDERLKMVKTFKDSSWIAKRK